MIIDELITILGYEIENDKELDKYERQLDSVSNVLNKVVRATGAAIASTAAFITVVSKANDNLIKTADIAGEAFEDLQEFGFAAEQNGISVESFNSSILGLNTLIAQANRGIGAGVEVFSLLGLNIRDSNGELLRGTELLPQLAQALQGLDSQRQLDFIRQLGLDDRFLLLLSNGADGIAELRQQARDLTIVLSEEGGRRAELFVDTLNGVLRTIRGISNQIVDDFLPAATEMLKVFQQWLLVNREVLTDVRGLVDSLGGLNRILNILLVTVTALIATALGTFLAKVVVQLRAVFATLTLVNAAAAFLPTVLGALVLLLAAVLEDVKVFSEGGESALGDLLAFLNDEFPLGLAVLETFGGIVDRALDAVRTFVNVSMSLLRTLLALLQGDLLQAWREFGEGGQAILDFAGRTGDFLTDVPIVNAVNELAPLQNLHSATAGPAFGQGQGLIRNRGQGEPSRRSQTLFGRRGGDTIINAPITVNGSASPENTANTINNRLNDVANRVRRNVTNAVDNP